MIRFSIKKSQASLEFLLILIFVFSIIFMLMYVMGNYSIDLKKRQEQATVQNFADSILAENKIMLNAKGGYYRELEIPKYLTDRYNLTVRNGYLIVLDLAIVDVTTQNSTELLQNANFYLMPPSGVTFIFNSTTGIAKFIFQKNNTIDYTNVIIMN